MSQNAHEQRRAENQERVKGKTIRFGILSGPQAETAKELIIGKRSVCFRCPDGLDGPIHTEGTILKSYFDKLDETCFVRIQAVDAEGHAEDIGGHVLVRALPDHPVTMLTEGRLKPLPNSMLFTRAFSVSDYELLGINQFSIPLSMLMSFWMGVDALEMLILPKLHNRRYLMEHLHFMIADDHRYRDYPPRPDHLITCNFGDGHPVDLLPIGADLGPGRTDAWREMNLIYRNRFAPLGVKVEVDSVFEDAIRDAGFSLANLGTNDGSYEGPKPSSRPVDRLFRRAFIL